MNTRRGFTLIELLISIAIVVVLMLGIQQVFSIASSSIGAGQALSTVNRENRGGHAVMYDDLKGAALTDGPFFIIRSSRIAAFRNATERQADLDYTDGSTGDVADNAIRTVDYDGDNIETLTPRTAINARNHRVDMLKFFARGLFRRQTGDDGVFTSDMASSEAFVSYAHVNQPPDVAGMNTAGSVAPGAGTATTNANNFYAQQWVLGRNLLTLREPELTGSDLVIEEVPGDPNTRQWYQGRSPTATNANIGPLSQQSQATERGIAGSFDANAQIQYSRYDLAGTSIRTYTRRVRDAILGSPVGTGPFNPDWFLDVTYRFSGFPTPTKPHTAFGTARAVPVFVPGCSQFVVEYAGDFLTQNPDTGEATDVLPDGVIDFVYQNVNGFDPIRKTRWYGFPRNVDTSDDLPTGPVIKGGSHPQAGAGGEFLTDVVPLRDVIFAASGGGGEPAPFERRLNPSGPPTNNRLPVRPNYADTTTQIAATSEYLVAWGPPGTFTDLAGLPVSDPPYPRMIRVLIGIDDVNGRLSDAQLFEYVIDLP